MVINIVGAGPTGVTIAWELSRIGMEVHVWEKRDTCGGSWWEPDGVRDMHAPRVLFKRAYANFRSLLCEMGLRWDDYFKKSDAVEKSLEAIKKYFSFSDYSNFLKLIFRAKSDPYWAKTTTLCDYGGNRLMEVMPIAIDGVTWDRMTVWEFVDSIDTTIMSTPYTQRGSGRDMGEDMELALLKNGVKFHFNEELVDVEYSDDNSFIASFKSGKTIGEGTLVLAVDPGPARRFVKDNWGPDAIPILDKVTYGCVNVLFWYNNPPELDTDIGALAKNNGAVFPLWIDRNTLSCGIYKTCGIPPDNLAKWICDTIGAPFPDEHTVCWGSKWDGSVWEHEQTSGIYTPTPLPVWGKCPHVAMVGMMSPREISFASIESAAEVGRRFVRDNYGGPGPIYMTTASTFVLMLFIIIFFIIVL